MLDYLVGFSTKFGNSFTFQYLEGVNSVIMPQTFYVKDNREVYKNNKIHIMYLEV